MYNRILPHTRKNWHSSRLNIFPVDYPPTVPDNRDKSYQRLPNVIPSKQEQQQQQHGERSQLRYKACRVRKEKKKKKKKNRNQALELIRSWTSNTRYRIPRMTLLQRGLRNILKKSASDVVFVSALRTPVTRATKGGFKDAHPEELLSHVRPIPCVPFLNLSLDQLKSHHRSSKPLSNEPKSTPA